MGLTGYGVGEGHMVALADNVRSVIEPYKAASGFALSVDAEILRWARRESIRTSAGAFLSTAADIEAKSSAYWEHELSSSTWAIAEKGGRILGIAAAKVPDPRVDEDADPDEVRFIESVWIDPSARRCGLGEQLVQYLIETQRCRQIERFYLWVLHENRPAIELYKYLGFKFTYNEHSFLNPLNGGRVRERQYLKMYDSNLIDETELARNFAARERIRRIYGIQYRLLGVRDESTEVQMLQSAFDRVDAWQIGKVMMPFSQACPPYLDKFVAEVRSDLIQLASCSLDGGHRLRGQLPIRNPF
jgi:ribosomal protein S18 acetylase RimI-like enzyme